MGYKDELINSVDLTKHRYSERCDKATFDLIHKGWDSESYLITTLLAELITAENQRNELEQGLKQATDTIAEYQHVLSMFDDEGSYEVSVEIDEDDNCHILMGADDWYRLQALSSMKRVHPKSFMDQGDAELLESPWVDVNEGLPDEEVIVLAKTVDNELLTATHEGDWREAYDRCLLAVTRWMPIPGDEG